MGEDVVKKTTEYYSLMFNYARKIVKNEHDAEDIVQQSFLNLTRANDSLNGNNLQGLVRRVVYNASMTFLRSKKRNPVQNEEIDPDRFAATEIKDDVPAELSDALPRAMAQLPEEYRQILLDAADGLSYRAIAAKYTIPEGTAMSRLFRARKLMQEKLAPYDAFRLKAVSAVA